MALGLGLLAGCAGTARGSALVSPSNSCLRWFDGNMPPRGAVNEDARRAVSAWVSAGAHED